MFASCSYIVHVPSLYPYLHLSSPVLISCPQEAEADHNCLLYLPVALVSFFLHILHQPFAAATIHSLVFILIRVFSSFYHSCVCWCRLSLCFPPSASLFLPLPPSGTAAAVPRHWHEYCRAESHPPSRHWHEHDTGGGHVASRGRVPACNNQIHVRAHGDHGRSALRIAASDIYISTCI